MNKKWSELQRKLDYGTREFSNVFWVQCLASNKEVRIKISVILQRNKAKMFFWCLCAFAACRGIYAHNAYASLFSLNFINFCSKFVWNSSEISLHFSETKCFNVTTEKLLLDINTSFGINLVIIWIIIKSATVCNKITAAPCNKSSFPF